MCTSLEVEASSHCLQIGYSTMSSPIKDDMGWLFKELGMNMPIFVSLVWCQPHIPLKWSTISHEGMNFNWASLKFNRLTKVFLFPHPLFSPTLSVYLVLLQPNTSGVFPKFKPTLILKLHLFVIWLYHEDFECLHLNPKARYWILSKSHGVFFHFIPCCNYPSHTQ